METNLLLFSILFPGHLIYFTKWSDLNIPGINMALISGHSQAQMEYEPTLWAKIFHSIPHVNITFHDVDPKFNPENDLYLESLGILASVPAGEMKLLFVVDVVVALTSISETLSVRLVSSHWNCLFLDCFFQAKNL